MPSRNLPFTVRVDTDGRFFFISDTDEEYPSDSFTLDEIKEQKGYCHACNAIMVSAFSQLSDARVDFIAGTASHEFADADQQFDLEIETESGSITIHGGPSASHEPITVNVDGETTLLRIARYNTGKHDSESYKLDDKEFLSHLEWERFEVCIISVNAG